VYLVLRRKIHAVTDHHKGTAATASNGLIAEAKRWVSYDGDLNRYLPIGIYDAYSCSFLLYEIGTGRIFIEDLDNEGFAESEPVADSLKELILGLYLK